MGSFRVFGSWESGQYGWGCWNWVRFVYLGHEARGTRGLRLGLFRVIGGGGAPGIRELGSFRVFGHGKAGKRPAVWGIGFVWHNRGDGLAGRMAVVRQIGFADESGRNPKQIRNSKCQVRNVMQLSGGHGLVCSSCLKVHIQLGGIIADYLVYVKYLVKLTTDFHGLTRILRHRVALRSA